jgi:hypothetical protein
MQYGPQLLEISGRNRTGSFGCGLLPSVNEAALRRTVAAIFDGHHSFGSWWESAEGFFVPEFVEWVEEQRSNAA